MKTIMAVLMSMVMAIALVPCAFAATPVSSGHMTGTVCMAGCGVAGLTAPAAAETTAPAATGHACVSTPAYTDYVNVHPVPCPVNGKPLQTPWVMGAVSW